MKSLELFRQALESRGITVSKLILFGSFATGHAHEGSDIDVVVISDDFEGRGYWERINLLSSTIYEVFAPIEAVGMTQTEWDNDESRIVDFARNGIVVPSQVDRVE